jgi:uncharacterized membrane protein YkgB
MNIGYAVAGLGILGIIVGMGFYAAGWHKTIGLGGVALGIVLLVIGVWFAMTQKKPAPPASQPQQ